MNYLIILSKHRFWVCGSWVDPKILHFLQACRCCWFEDHTVSEEGEAISRYLFSWGLHLLPCWFFGCVASSLKNSFAWGIFSSQIPLDTVWVATFLFPKWWQWLGAITSHPLLWIWDHCLAATYLVALPWMTLGGSHPLWASGSSKKEMPSPCSIYFIEWKWSCQIMEVKLFHKVNVCYKGNE